MLVQALQVHLDTERGDRIGWFVALADKQLSAAIRAIHLDPAHKWKRAIGCSPRQYGRGQQPDTLKSGIPSCITARRPLRSPPIQPEPTS
jgi:hypothetical protein